MGKTWILALVMTTSLMTTSLMAQTPAKDPDALQALLVEVKQLRQDIESMTVASQRVQIALHALQLQDAATARAAQRLDEARKRKAQIDDGRAHLAAEIQKWQDTQSSGKLSEADSKSVEQRLQELKSELDRTAVEAQSRDAEEGEATSQFRTEQGKLTDLQDRIDRLDKVLEKMGK